MPPFCISVPNFVKIGHTVAKISQFLLVFKMAAAAILDFQKLEILTADSLYGANMRHCTKPRSKTVAEIWPFNGFFSNRRPSAILDLLGADFDHPRRPLDGLYRCAKFG